jgi:hypothetical protein
MLSNALEPGWVATKMGGSGATDELDQAHRTQVWLAVSDDPAASVSGEYFYHMEKRDPLCAISDWIRSARRLRFSFTGFHVEVGGVGEHHEPFFKERRTRGSV